MQAGVDVIVLDSSQVRARLLRARAPVPPAVSGATGLLLLGIVRGCAEPLGIEDSWRVSVCVVGHLGIVRDRLQLLAIWCTTCG